MKTNVILKVGTLLYRSSFMYVFILLCFAGFLNSCEEEEVWPSMIAHEKTSQVEPTTWQEQIKYAQSKNSIATKNYDMNKPCLLSYTYKGIIDTEAKRQELLKSLFADTTMVIWYRDSWHFEILPLEEAKEKSKVEEHNFYTLIEDQLRKDICIGMEMIDLVWRYKGKSYYSTAIVSNEHGGFVYEHIGYRLIGSEEGLLEEDDSLDMNFLRTKTSSESSDSEGNIILRFTKIKSIKNYYGTVVVTCNIKVRSVFNRAGILIDRNLNATHTAEFGYTCSADVRTISGTLDSSTYHEFAWGYAYGSGVSISLGWNGTGFTVSAGAQGATGTEVHRP